MSFLSHQPDRFPNRAWLLPVVPVAESVPASLDRILGEAAFAARAGDRSARDALFAAFCPRLERSIRRCQLIWAGQSSRFTEDAIEPSDIDQEAYLAFIELVADWTPGDSLSAHVLGRFPWRMNHVLRHWRRQRGPRNDRSLLLMADARTPLVDAELAILVEDLAARLDPLDAELLRQRALGHLSFDEIAHRAGISERTLRRRWRTIANAARGVAAS